jgi:uncharacterized membrane-anchored protein
MASRAGSALILLGLIALTVFLVTFSANQADVRVLLLGASLAGVGLLLRRRAARTQQRESRRFRAWRRITRRSPDEEE